MLGDSVSDVSLPVSYADNGVGCVVAFVTTCKAPPKEKSFPQHTRLRGVTHPVARPTLVAIAIKQPSNCKQRQGVCTCVQESHGLNIRGPMMASEANSFCLAAQYQAKKPTKKASPIQSLIKDISELAP